MLQPRLFTTRIPHHSSRSGYEQLVRFVPEREVVVVERINDRRGWRRQVERVLRRAAANRWYMWDGIISEWNALKRDRSSPAVNHFLYGDHTIGLLPYVKRWMKSPLVLTIHACPSDLPEIMQYPRLLNAVDHFILLGSNQEPFFRKLGIGNHRMSVLLHGVDLQFFRPDAQEVRNANTVLIVGNWRRNFPLYRAVIEKMPDVRFRIVTARHNHTWFDGLDRKQVTLLSGISDEVLVREYQTAGAMLLSMTDAVANNVLLEALACGLPVVCEPVGAVSEYVGSDYPFLFTPGDVTEAVHKLRECLAASPSNDQFTEIAARFDWKQVARDTIEVYRRLGK
jgi:glycosyltransferase involved in cell wall biosynthesis